MLDLHPVFEFQGSPLTFQPFPPNKTKKKRTRQPPRMTPWPRWGCFFDGQGGGRVVGKAKDLKSGRIEG